MVTIDKCIHCHKCRDNCDFLSKYGIDICDLERLRELAYHCFLCGRCTYVCPVGIDGRELILELRRERAGSDEHHDIETTYKGLIAEKRNYRFRNWKHASSGSVFFPGCNFPSMYPKTNNAMMKLFKEHGIGTVFECCGKPISELGFSDDEDRIITDIRRRLEEAGINEIVTACPNCRDFFGDRLGVKVRSVYDKLNELGRGSMVARDIVFYIPCPDRKKLTWINEIRTFVGGRISINDSAQCCGLGGSAIVCESEIADGFASKLEAGSKGPVFTYCASCAGRFRRCGIEYIDHILPVIMGIDEQPDIRKSFINRVLTKIR